MANKRPVKPNRPRKGCSLAEVAPDIAAEWDFEANGDYTPDNVSAHSAYVAGWVSPEGYKWRARVSQRVERKTSCPHKAKCGRNKQLTPETSLAAVNPKLAAEWDQEKNGDLTPWDVFPNSNMPVFWRCEKHGVVWQAQIANRHSKGTGCPKCANEKRAAATKAANERRARERKAKGE